MRKIVESIDSLLKKEKGTIFKDHGGKIKICLVYPDIYQVGITNLGFQTVYRLFNLRKDVVCERAFLPSQHEIGIYEKGYPLLSMESKKPLYEFDIVAFSLCFENDYPNILKILNFAKIPYNTNQRNHKHPLIVAGGVLCFSNPEPVAEIFDIIFIGEAEELIDDFIELYKNVKESSYEEDFKKALKREVLRKEGFYVPEAYEEKYEKNSKLIGRQVLWKEAPDKIKRVYCKKLDESFAFSQIITSEAIFKDMYLIETMRGCPFRCRFCLVGHIYQPVRKVSVERIKDKLEEIKSIASCVGIIAPSLTAYKELRELLKYNEVEFSFTSLRADSTTLEVLNELVRHKTLTVAPEAGSERLRRLIKKGITEQDLLLLAQKIGTERGSVNFKPQTFSTSDKRYLSEVETLKLYFMIGLPFEKDEDIDEIVRLVKKVRALFNRKITVSVSIFVPKPFTPFQWHRMENMEVVKERLKKLKKDMLQIKGVRLLHEVPKYSYMQGYFARQTRKALSIIERVCRGENFSKIFEEVKDFLYETKNYEDYLPWDFIEHGGIVSREYLWNEYRKAIAESNF